MTQPLPIDQFIGNPDEFPILEKWAFFNHAGVSPLPRRAAMAIVKYAGQAAEEAYIDCNWFKQIEVLRKARQALSTPSRSEIAFVKNTSEGLALVANGIDFQPGDRIVTTAVEYPANAYPWIDLQKRKGIELIRVEEKQFEDAPAGSRCRTSWRPPTIRERGWSPSRTWSLAPANAMTSPQQGPSAVSATSASASTPSKASASCPSMCGP